MIVEVVKLWHRWYSNYSSSLLYEEKIGIAKFQLSMNLKPQVSNWNYVMVKHFIVDLKRVWLEKLKT